MLVIVVRVMVTAIYNGVLRKRAPSFVAYMFPMAVVICYVPSVAIVCVAIALDRRIIRAVSDLWLYGTMLLIVIAMISVYARLWRESGSSGTQRGSLSIKTSVSSSSKVPPAVLSAQRTTSDLMIKKKAHPMSNSLVVVVSASVLGGMWAIYRVYIELDILIRGVQGPLAYNTNVFPVGNLLKPIASLLFLRYTWTPVISTGPELDEASYAHINRSPTLRAAHAKHSMAMLACKNSGGVKSSLVRASLDDTARPKAGLNDTPTVAEHSSLVGVEIDRGSSDSAAHLGVRSDTPAHPQSLNPPPRHTI
jgi:hypothetical protein